MQSWKNDVIKTHATHSIAYMSDKSDQHGHSCDLSLLYLAFSLCEKKHQQWKKLARSYFRKCKSIFEYSKENFMHEINMKKLALIFNFFIYFIQNGI